MNTACQVRMYAFGCMQVRLVALPELVRRVRFAKRHWRAGLVGGLIRAMAFTAALRGGRSALRLF
jgi:hypothetical protein